MESSMKKILFLFIFSVCIAQNPIEIREYRFYKDKDVDEINIFDLIQEADGLFEVTLIKVDNLKYEKKRKRLVGSCELEFEIELGSMETSIELCNGYTKSNNSLIIEKNYRSLSIGNMVFKYDKFKYLEGEFIFRISGEYKSSKAKSNRSDNGILREWYDNGQKKNETTYIYGEKKGLMTQWYENGQKKFEGTYKDRKEDGLWTQWYENGQKRKGVTFKDGRKDGLCTYWYKSGKKSGERNYKDGNLDGIFTKWYKNGEKKSEGTYKDGERVSERLWNKNGSVK